MSYGSSGLSAITTDGKTISGNGTGTGALAIGGGTHITIPAAANAIALTTGISSAWANPAAFTTMLASTPSATWITAVKGSFAFFTNAHEGEIDIATGAVSSEVVVATVRVPRQASANQTVTYTIPLAVPVKVASGVRISARGRQDSNDATGSTYTIALEGVQ